MTNASGEKRIGWRGNHRAALPRINATGLRPQAITCVGAGVRRRNHGSQRRHLKLGSVSCQLLKILAFPGSASLPNPSVRFVPNRTNQVTCWRRSGHLNVIQEVTGSISLGSTILACNKLILHKKYFPSRTATDLAHILPGCSGERRRTRAADPPPLDNPLRSESGSYFHRLRADQPGSHSPSTEPDVPPTQY